MSWFDASRQRDARSGLELGWVGVSHTGYGVRCDKGWVGVGHDHGYHWFWFNWFNHWFNRGCFVVFLPAVFFVLLHEPFPPSVVLLPFG